MQGTAMNDMVVAAMALILAGDTFLNNSYNESTPKPIQIAKA